MEEKHVLIICGEPSGELHAANLVQAIKQINPAVEISGIGSDLLHNADVDVFYDIRGLTALGLFDVFKKLPRFLRLKRFLLKKIEREKPDAVIFVDFSGFNLRLAKAINNRVATIYYIGPQVWASREGRVKTIKKYISKLIVIFPFEKEFYKRHGIDADFVGHPLLDIVSPTLSKNEFLQEFGFSPQKKTIALLPGSRKSEINYILPVMLKAAVEIQKKVNNVQFLIAKPPHLDLKLYTRKMDSFKLNLKIIEDRTYDCLQAADFALVASGTATLEAAILETPLVVIYKMGLLNYLLYKPQVKVPYIGMVNIVAGKKIAEEFIQFGTKPKKIADFVSDTLNNPQRLATLKQNLSPIKTYLEEGGASLRAARIIVDFLENL